MKIHTFHVTPALPARLEKLRDLAYNLYLSWAPDVVDLFTRLDQDLWVEVHYNPVQFLGRVSQKRLDEAAGDDGYLATLEMVHREFLRATGGTRTWYSAGESRPQDMVVAYFSMEFGLHECMPLYSGGLGMLSGDHLKSASELGIPLVGVGILYQKGYFKQYLNSEGYQQESNIENDFSTMPLHLIEDDAGKPVRVSLRLPGRDLVIQVWRADVGRTRLFLLDTNIQENSRSDQDLTDFLYGGDADMRICQEMILGIGGLRALDVLGIHPTVCHMNEGHAAFLGLERIRVLMERQGLDFATAREIACASNCFTTHTPVPAGTDAFPPPLVDHYFADYARQLGLDMHSFMALGMVDPGNRSELFNMTVLAMRLSQYRNGVSRLHGKVSRGMWQPLWPGLRGDEVPITHITNGVFHKTWLSPDMRGLFDRYLGPKWREDPSDPTAWEHVAGIPAEELWRTHERRRERLVAFTRRKLSQQLEQRNASPSEIDSAGEVLDPDALTIGFARRFASYKRSTLLFRDMDRLERIIDATDRPVQFIIAGKAHPKDGPGKDLIRSIVQWAREDRFRRSVVFLENYDMVVARYMLQGVDVWLNTPRRPNEASGTSGMKAVVNGAIQMSVLDGWWDEAYFRGVGWAIGRGEIYDDPVQQDEIESRAIYDILEKEVVPLFYDRGADGLPRGWVDLVKSSMMSLCPVYNTNRMLVEYSQKFYEQAHRRQASLVADRQKRARTLADWKRKVMDGWKDVAVLDVQASTENLKVGDQLEVRATVRLGKLGQEDVAVQFIRGNLDQRDNLIDPVTLDMETCGTKGKNVMMCSVGSPLRGSGLQGYAIRVIPRHEDLVDLVDLPIVVWG